MGSQSSILNRVGCLGTMNDQSWIRCSLFIFPFRSIHSKHSSKQSWGLLSLERDVRHEFSEWTSCLIRGEDKRQHTSACKWRSFLIFDFLLRIAYLTSIMDNHTRWTNPTSLLSDEIGAISREIHSWPTYLLNVIKRSQETWRLDLHMRMKDPPCGSILLYF